MDVRFVQYSEVYMYYSRKWLSDPEIKKLTMTPDIDDESQLIWFKGLESRNDYLIWGIEADGMPVGAVGIKYIDYTNCEGEYWGYIGEKKLHGKGIGGLMLAFIIEKAKEIGIKRLLLHVADYNLRAYKLYIKQGFIEVDRCNGVLLMERAL